MKGIVKKSVKGNWHNIGTIESWLSDMAKDGLVLKEIGRVKAVFEPGPKSNTQYRIKYIPYEAKVEDRLINGKELTDLYFGFGWQHVCSFEELYVFKTTGTDYKELPYYNFETVYFRKKINKGIISILPAFFAVGLNLYNIFSHPSIFLGKYGVWLFTMILISFVAVFTPPIVFLIYKRRLRTRGIDHNADWKRAYLKSIISLSGALVFIFIVIVFFIGFFRPDEKLHLDDSYADVIRLSDIESEQDLIYSKHNYIVYSSSFLSPEHYSLYEQARIHNGTQEVWEPYIGVEYYELRFEFFAKSLLKDLADFYYDGTYTLESRYFDYVRVFDTNYIRLYIIKDNTVISITYEGNFNAEQVLDGIEEKLKSMEMEIDT